MDVKFFLYINKIYSICLKLLVLYSILGFPKIVPFLKLKTINLLSFLLGPYQTQAVYMIKFFENFV